MKSMVYPVQLTADDFDGGFTVTCRDFAEVITQGDTPAACLAQAADCLEEAVASRIKRDVNIPEPSAPLEGEHLVGVPLTMSLKAALYMALKEEGITKSELARRMNCDEKDIRRLLDPRHPSKAPTRMLLQQIYTHFPKTFLALTKDLVYCHPIVIAYHTEDDVDRG